MREAGASGYFAPMSGSKKGERRGGRQKGTKNKATIAREEAARAEFEAAMKATASKTRGTGVSPKLAMQEMYKAISIAEGVAGKLQPKDISQDVNGKLTITGGDLKAFGDWFDRWVKGLELLAKYQIPAIKPIEAPAPPPTPEELEQGSRKRFGLRIFEGGRPLQQPVDGKDKGVA